MRSLSVKGLGALLIMSMSSILPTGQPTAPHKVDILLNTSRAKEIVASGEIDANGSIFNAALAQPDNGNKHFAFGFLEFDWDPRIHGGLPGFDNWPVQKL
jgi:hypothetical protein